MSQGSTGSPRKAPPGSSRSNKRGFTILPLLDTDKKDTDKKGESETTGELVAESRTPSTTRRKTRGRGPDSMPASLEQVTDAGPGTNSNVVTFARARRLIWAIPRGETLRYEVSKAVNTPLQARCKTAPLCPGESPKDGLPGWIQPNGAPVGACPYDYATRGQCISDRNIEALVAALFLPAEARLVSNYLSALGYNVREEELPADSLDGTRILNAHARIGNSHEVRVMGAPSVGEIVLVRNLADDR